MSEAKISNDITEDIDILKKTMSEMKNEIDHIKSVLDDKFLSEADKTVIDETLRAEKEGKLVSMDDVFN